METFPHQEVVPMNHSVSSTQFFDNAIASFLYFKSAEGLRDRSIDSYLRILDHALSIRD
jgi:hypothetical protein